MEKALMDGVITSIKERKQFSASIREYLLAPTGKVSIPSNSYSTLIDGVRVKDITSEEQFRVGITILQVFADKEIDFNEHIHDKQSQIIYVIDGKILDLDTGLMFKPGQSFLVPKAHLHAVRYFKDTQAIIVYMPRLSSS